MKTIRPTTTEPIPARSSPPQIGIIIVRFVGLLVVIVAVLAWGWSR